MYGNVMSSAKSAAPHRRRVGKKTIWIVLAIVVFMLMAYSKKVARDEYPANVMKGNGRVGSEEHVIATMLPGRVSRILVNEGDPVKEGQVVAELESDDQNDALHLAKEGVAAAKARRAALEGRLGDAANQKAIMLSEYENARKMAAKNYISSQELKKVKAGYDNALANLKAANSALVEADAMVKSAELKEKEASRYLTRTKLLSPIDGVAHVKVVETGAVLPAGGRVFTVLKANDFHLDVFYPTNVVSKLKLGEDARIRIDGMPKVFPAKVSHIESQAQFTPKFVETRDERSKFMFRVRLQIPEDIARNYAGFLKTGIPADGFINLDKSRNFPAEFEDNLAGPNDNPQTSSNGVKRTDGEVPASKDDGDAPSESHEPSQANDSASAGSEVSKTSTPIFDTQA